MAIELDDYDKQSQADNGGIDEFIVYEIVNRDTYTLAAGVITALSMKTGEQAYRWTPDLESASANDGATRSRENNSYLRNHAAMIIFKDDEDVTAKLSENAGRGFFGIIVKKSHPTDSIYRHLGLINGMTLEEEEGAYGQLYEDLRGHTLNFVGKELSRAPSISAAIVATLLNPPS